jgi:hypothetical protein
MASTKRAAALLPYVERLADDRDLQRDLREAISALRVSYSRAEAKHKRPSRMLADKKLSRNAQRAATSLSNAALRLRGKQPEPRRGRRVMLVAVVIGAGAAITAREMLKRTAAALRLQLLDHRAASLRFDEFPLF